MNILKNELIDQYNFERYSSDLYRGIAHEMNLLSFLGAYEYFKSKAEEEREHAEDFANFLLDNSILPDLDALDPIRPGCKSIRDAAALALDHERKVSGRIREISETARAVGNDVTYAFIHKYLLEQVEEEDEAGEILDWCNVAGMDPAAILEIDNRLGKKD